MNPITLPRTTVLKLLHLAQQGAGSGFITRLPDGALHIRAIKTGDAAAKLGRQFAEGGETPFAFYRASSQVQPEAKDMETWQSVTRLFLSVSVGTKGVLQLRGWEAHEGKPDPVELSLAEEDAAQNSGVSRKA
jgi:hypothetical protein